MRVHPGCNTLSAWPQTCECCASGHSRRTHCLKSCSLSGGGRGYGQASCCDCHSCSRATLKCGSSKIAGMAAIAGSAEAPCTEGACTVLRKRWCNARADLIAQIEHACSYHPEVMLLAQTLQLPGDAVLPGSQAISSSPSKQCHDQPCHRKPVLTTISSGPAHAPQQSVTAHAKNQTAEMPQARCS